MMQLEYTRKQIMQINAAWLALSEMSTRWNSSCEAHLYAAKLLENEEFRHLPEAKHAVIKGVLFGLANPTLSVAGLGDWRYGYRLAVLEGVKIGAGRTTHVQQHIDNFVSLGTAVCAMHNEVFAKQHAILVEGMGSK